MARKSGKMGGKMIDRIFTYLWETPLRPFIQRDDKEEERDREKNSNADRKREEKEGNRKRRTSASDMASQSPIDRNAQAHHLIILAYSADELFMVHKEQIDVRAFDEMICRIHDSLHEHIWRDAYCSRNRRERASGEERNERRRQTDQC